MTAERENCASRRAILKGAPALAVIVTGGIASAAAAAEPSELSKRIAAHREAKAAYDAATNRTDALDGSFVPIDPETIIRGFSGGYAFKLGRTKVLELLEQGCAATIANARRSYVATRFMPRAEHAKAIVKMERVRDRRIAEANAVFDREQARYAASGVGAAEQAETAASNVENDALHALIACPCRTLAEVAEKAAYLRETWIANLPQKEHMTALLQSMIDTGGSNV